LDGVGDNPFPGEVVARIALEETVNAKESADDGETRDCIAYDGLPEFFWSFR
jgi:hypothetical protein